MPKILLVEDEEISALVMLSVLSDAGYAVTKAAGYNEALDAAAIDAPDLLITDWRLDDGFTGNDIATELSKRNPALHVIFISGLESQEIRNNAQHLKLLAVIEKPCDFDEVVALVKRNFPKV